MRIDKLTIRFEGATNFFELLSDLSQRIEREYGKEYTGIIDIDWESSIDTSRCRYYYYHNMFYDKSGFYRTMYDRGIYSLEDILLENL